MNDVIHVSLLRRMVDALGELPEADQVSVLGNLAYSLLKRRATILKSLGELEGEGFFPKYVVFNNLTGAVDDDTFVIDPKSSPVDMETIEFYAQRTDSEELREALNNWIYSHKNYTCPYPVRVDCPIVGYNLCCGHCPNSDVCFIEGNPHLCDKVANNMFTSSKECDGS